jgi:hypothetical protein
VTGICLSWLPADADADAAVGFDPVALGASYDAAAAVVLARVYTALVAAARAGMAHFASQARIGRKTNARLKFCWPGAAVLTAECTPSCPP